MRRALFGGSFDPFHNGHRTVVETLLARGLCAQVVLVPAGLSPGKAPPRATGRHREAMTLLGLSGLAHASVLDLELRRAGPSYTVDTLTHLKALCPDDDWLLVVGADAWRDFGSWRDPQRLLSLARIVVFARDGQPPEAAPPASGVTWLDDFRVAAASSEIRRRLEAGDDVAHLVPAPVLDYIRTHGLYGRDGDGVAAWRGEEPEPCP